MMAFNKKGLSETAAVAEPAGVKDFADQPSAEDNDYLKSVFDNAPVGIYQSIEDRLIRVNPTFARMFGYENPAEMLASGRHPAGYFAENGKREEILRKVKATCGYYKQEVEYRRKDDSIFAASLRMRVVRDESGGVMFFEGFVEDMSDFKQAERKATAALEYVRILLRSAPIGIVTYRATGETVSANPAVAVMLGGTMEEILKQNFHTLESWKKSGLYAAAQRALQAGQTEKAEIRHLSTFGKTLYLSAQLIPFAYAAEPHLLLLMADITEQKQGEAALRESEERLRQMAENLSHIFWITDKENDHMLYVSPAYEKILGRSCQSLYERPKSFLDAIHPDDLPRVLEAIARERQGENFDEQYRIARSDGAVRWIHARNFAVRDAEGRIFRHTGIAEDITEKRQIEEQLRQAQKMEEIGRLAGGVAHDFNNIVAAILMNLGYLQQSPQLTFGTRETLKEIESEAMRAANLTRQLLLFSRQHVVRLEPLDVNALIQGLLKMLRRLLRENIEIDFRDDSGALYIQADGAMLEQLVMNLCVNARDAMPKGGRLTLHTSLVERTDDSAKSHSEARPGRFVCLAVADTGCGMDATVQEHIFEPFFTTKEVGKGTGLGLATVYGVAKQHRGWIEVESVVGQGSSFRVFLPALVKAPEGPAPPKNAPAPAAGGGETILLVEDELALRRASALCLRKLGYAVLEAANGAQALKVWEQNRNEIDLLLTDMIMPGAVTGAELAERLRVDKPALPVIVSSGYSGGPPEGGQAHPGMTFLDKPFRLPVLAAMVRQCLDKNKRETNGNNEHENLPGR